MKIIRAKSLPERAGAYYVRIQAMARKYNITLEQEFDAHDTPDTDYVVALDDDFPVATCRLFPIGGDVAEIGRVVVLEEYRGRGLGSLVISEAEQWIKEQGYKKAIVKSRDIAVGFYEKLGYRKTGKEAEAGQTFVCVEMEKEII